MGTMSQVKHSWIVSTAALLLRTAVVPLVRVAAAFWRKDIRGMEHLDHVQQGAGGILVAWHGELFTSIHTVRDRGLVGLVSPVWEGELIGQFMRGFGFRLVRGSSGTSPTAGLKASLRALKEGHVVATILDGPEGPPHIAKPGALYMASMSGKPIIPMVMDAHPSWRAPSWDHHLVPFPGSRLVVRLGEPLVVPPHLNKEELPHWIEELTRRMDALEEGVEEALHGATLGRLSKRLCGRSRHPE